MVCKSLFLSFSRNIGGLFLHMLFNKIVIIEV